MRTILKEEGAEFRVFHPPRFDSPSAIAVTHRKTITVDGRIGLCSDFAGPRNGSGYARGDGAWRRQPASSFGDPAVAN